MLLDSGCKSERRILEIQPCGDLGRQGVWHGQQFDGGDFAEGRRPVEGNADFFPRFFAEEGGAEGGEVIEHRDVFPHCRFVCPAEHELQFALFSRRVVVGIGDEMPHPCLVRRRLHDWRVTADELCERGELAMLDAKLRRPVSELEELAVADCVASAISSSRLAQQSVQQIVACFRHCVTETGAIVFGGQKTLPWLDKSAQGRIVTIQLFR